MCLKWLVGGKRDKLIRASPQPFQARPLQHFYPLSNLELARVSKFARLFTLSIQYILISSAFIPIMENQPDTSCALHS